RWEVTWTIIGHVTGDRLIHVMDGDREVATLPVGTLVEAPEYIREGFRPPELDEFEALDLLSLPDLASNAVGAGLASFSPRGDVPPRIDGERPIDVEPKPVPTDAGAAVVESRPASEDPLTANAALLRLLGSPNIASKRWVYRQYDQS